MRDQHNRRAAPPAIPTRRRSVGGPALRAADAHSGAEVEGVLGPA